MDSQIIWKCKKQAEVALKIAEDGTVKVVNAMSTGTQSVGLFSKLVAGATKVFGDSAVPLDWLLPHLVSQWLLSLPELLSIKLGEKTH